MNARARGGFTLVEMVVSLAVVGLIGAALASTLSIAARALPSPGALPELETAARAAAVEMAADLPMAGQLKSISEHAIEFSVPDQNGDGSSEVIGWRWTGVAGGPLVRTVNGVSSTRLAALDGFTLEWVTTQALEQTGWLNVEGAEQLLARFAEASDSTSNITLTSYPAQYFVPSLPADAVSYSLTRIMTRFVSSSATTVNVQICADSGLGTPGAGLYSGSIAVGKSADELTDQFAGVSGVVGRVSGTGLWIKYGTLLVLGGPKLPYKGQVANGNTRLATTGTSGLTWTQVFDGSALFAAYGTVVRPRAVMSAVTRVQSVRLTLLPSGQGTRKVTSGVVLLARPTLPSSPVPLAATDSITLPVGVTITSGVSASGSAVVIDTSQVLNGLASGLSDVLGGGK